MTLQTTQDILTPFFNDIKLPFALILLTLLFCTTTYCLIVIEQFRLKQKAKQSSNNQEQTTNTTSAPIKKLTVLRYVVYLIVCLSGMLCIASISLFKTAYDHGYREYKKHTISEIIYSIKHSPIEDTLPDNKQNITVIYYRFGCEDCNKLYTELSERFANISDVYWIATRSQQGQKLREQYPVESVPSAIFITDENTATAFDLYTKNTDNNNKVTITTNDNSITKLLQYRSNHLKEKE